MRTIQKAIQYGVINYVSFRFTLFRHLKAKSEQSSLIPSEESLNLNFTLNSYHHLGTFILLYENFTKMNDSQEESLRLSVRKHSDSLLGIQAIIVMFLN
jgi:hypothetical protein